MTGYPILAQKKSTVANGWHAKGVCWYRSSDSLGPVKWVAGTAGVPPACVATVKITSLIQVRHSAIQRGRAGLPRSQQLTWPVLATAWPDAVGL